MLRLVLLFVLGLFSVGVSTLGHKNYDGFQVVTLTLAEDQLTFLDTLKSRVQFDIWRDPMNSNGATYETDIMVASKDSSHVTQLLHENKIFYEVKIKNLGSLISSQREASRKYQEKRSVTNAEIIDWNDYYPTDKIYNWMDEIAANNSDIATIISLGQSTLGRDLKMVRISLNSSANKPAVLIDGTIHAREWISTSICTWIINQMLGHREVNRDVLEVVDIYVIPILNVDGYDYTHSNDRLWRKTRKDHGDVDGCIGVDANRNFDFHFAGEGTSEDKCSEIYTGPAPFSEPEMGALRDLMLDHTINWKGYFTIHSYSQRWFTPWSHTIDLPEDYDDLLAVGHIGASALTAVHGTPYGVGATTAIGGMAAGCSHDYAKGVAGFKYAQALESRDLGEYGFLLPPEQIQDTVQENWAGIKAVSLFIANGNKTLIRN